MGRAAKNLKKRGTKVSRPAKDRKHFISKLVADPRVQVRRPAGPRGPLGRRTLAYACLATASRRSRRRPAAGRVEPQAYRAAELRAHRRHARDQQHLARHGRGLAGKYGRHGRGCGRRSGASHSVGRCGAADGRHLAQLLTRRARGPAAALPADAEVGPRRGKYYMSEDEQAYMRALIAKYGTNYEAMRRDTKLNWKQHTEGRLERRCERYRLLLEQQAQEAGGAAAPAAGADVFGELEAAHQAAEAAAGAPKAPVAAPAKHAAVAAAPAQAAAAAQPPPTEAKRTTKKAKAKKASA